MRQNKQKGISFQLGTFDEKKFKGHIITTLWRKSQVALRANLILSQKRHCWLRVCYRFNDKKLGDNEGVYKTIKDLKEALAQFTEKALLDYIYS